MFLRVQKYLEIIAHTNIWLALGVSACVWMLFSVTSLPFHPGPAMGFMGIGLLYTFTCVYLFEKTDRHFLCDVVVDGEFLFMGILVWLGVVVM